MGILAKETSKMQTITQYAITPQDQRYIIITHLVKERQTIWELIKLTAPIKHYKEVQPHVHTKSQYNKCVLPHQLLGL
jgi:hypothetical protein